MKPYVHIEKNFASLDECNYIINHFGPKCKEHLYGNGPLKGQTFPYLQNKHTGNIIKPTQVGIGYPVININVGGTTKIIQMHRLVGEAFIINPDPKIRTIVHHKNNDIEDWSIDNLWWITKKENSLLKQKKKKEPDQLSMNRMFSGGGFVG